MTAVRIAGPADRDEIFRLFHEAHAENGIMPPDLERVNWWVTRMLHPDLIPDWDTNPRGVIGVIGKPEHLEAIAFLIIGNIWYSNSPHLEELIVYVDKKHRRGEQMRNDIEKHGSTHLKLIIGWMKEQSVLTGLPLFSGVLSVHRTQAKVRLYERLLPKVGAVFRFDPITHGSSSVQRSIAVH